MTCSLYCGKFWPILSGFVPMCTFLGFKVIGFSPLYFGDSADVVSQKDKANFSSILHGTFVAKSDRLSPGIGVEIRLKAGAGPN